MSTTLNGDMTQKLADEFSRIIRDWLKPHEMAEVLTRNRTYPPGVCASHDFRDANMAMAEAFELVTGRKPDPASEADAALWSASWVRARNSKFPRQLELVEHAEGAAAFSFTIKGLHISNPRHSECGRLYVDPAEHYGLRPEEIAALENANAMPRIIVRDYSERLVLGGRVRCAAIDWCAPVTSDDEAEILRKEVSDLLSEAAFEHGWDNYSTADGLRERAALLEARLVDPAWRIDALTAFQSRRQSKD